MSIPHNAPQFYFCNITWAVQIIKLLNIYFLCIPVTFCMLGLNILTTYFLNGNSNEVKYFNTYDIEIKMKYRQHWKTGQEIRYDILTIAFGNLKQLHRNQLYSILNYVYCVAGVWCGCVTTIRVYHVCYKRKISLRNRHGCGRQEEKGFDYNTCSYSVSSLNAIARRITWRNAEIGIDC